MSDQEGPWPRSVASIALRMGAGLRSSQVGDPTSKLMAERAAQVAVLSNPSEHFARSPPFKMNNVPRDHELIMEVIFLPRRNGIKTAGYGEHSWLSKQQKQKSCLAELGSKHKANYRL
uniref:Uncharacterized protein n=1 Tax=Populus alba TaxID=43335 RepID=A0A4U5QJI3_POPAL|nr:hypothetical protein D5086_0000079070 [Populus alba]